MRGGLLRFVQDSAHVARPFRTKGSLMKGELCGQRGNARAMRTVEIDEGPCAKGGLLRRLCATVSLRFVRRLPRLRDLGYNKKIAWGRGSPPNVIGVGCPSIAKEAGEPAKCDNDGKARLA